MARFDYRGARRSTPTPLRTRSTTTSSDAPAFRPFGVRWQHGAPRADQEAAGRRDRPALHDRARRRARSQRGARWAGRDSTRPARRDHDRPGDQAAGGLRGADPAALGARARARHHAGELTRDDRRRLHGRDRHPDDQPWRPRGPDRARPAHRADGDRAGRAGRARRGRRAAGHRARRRGLRLDRTMTTRARRPTDETGTEVYTPETRRALVGASPGDRIAEQATPTEIDSELPTPVASSPTPVEAMPVEQATPTVVAARPERSEPIRVISMKNRAPSEPRAEEPRVPLHVQLRSMAEVAGTHGRAAGLGHLAPPRDPQQARRRRQRDNVVWACAAILLACAISLGIWFIAGR